MLPLSTISWQESIRYLISEKATVLEWYDDWIVHSEHWKTKVPAVMMMREFQKKKSAVKFSKQNIFLRDVYICQYCGISVNRKSATLDHVLPTSKGGHSTWENCCTSCSRCNSIKGNNAKIVPSKLPYRPNYFQLVEKRKTLSWDLDHPSWRNYLNL